MKYVSFRIQDKDCFGILEGEKIADLTEHYEKFWQGLKWLPDLKTAIEQDRLESIAELNFDELPQISINEVMFLPVIPNPSKILCVGLNYEDHRAETKRPESKYPTIFTRFAESQIGHDQPLICPKDSERFDYEGELAIVIGKGGRDISEEKALDHVAGYSCYNDGSIRDWQRHTSQFTPGKNFPLTGPFGPYLVTSDEVGDYTKLPIETRLNGEVMQKAKLSDLIFPIPRLINYISTFTPLTIGDVIVTGTPGGVGDRRDPPVYMKPGDVVEVDIGKVGILMNFITE